MKTQVTFKFKILLLSALSIIAFIFAFNFISSINVKAETPVAKTELFLPKSDIEYYNVIEPIDVYSDDSLTAIAQADNSLIVYRNGKYSVLNMQFSALKQVKKFDDTTLLVSDSGAIYTVDLENDKKELLMFNNEHIGGNYFDLSDDYLITAYSNGLIIYTMENGIITGKDFESIPSGVDGDSPVCIYDQSEEDKVNKIFYVSTAGELCMHSTSDINTMRKIKDQQNNNIKPYKMVATDSAVYYVLSGDKNVYRVYTEQNNKELLTIEIDSRYQLGSLVTPSSISFKNENLIISDFSGSIQEFAIESNKLVFTGFAIAKGKTAYNRISSSVNEVERYGDMVAVLDEYKLSLINAKTDFDAYDKNNFTDYLKEDLDGAMPEAFALGTNSVLLSYDHGTSDGSLRLLNLSDKSLSNPIAPNYSVRDVCYQSGYYYVMLDDSNDNLIYRFSENSIDFSAETLIIRSQKTHCQKFTVDVFGNLYLYDDISSQSSLTKFNKTASGYTAEELPFIQGVIKLSTDLAGGLFALTVDSIYYLDKDNTWQQKEIELPEIGLKAKSFALNFDKKEVYLTFENSECVLKTTSLNNVAIDAIIIPEEFKTTDENAKALDKFKVYSAKQSANVYSVNIADSISYQNLIDVGEEYAFLCQMNISDGLGKDVSFYALAGQNATVIINATEVIDVTPTINSEVSEKAFVTTQANLYYLPIITPNGDYAVIKSASSPTEKIRLAKFTEIIPKGKLSFLGKEYYYADVLVDGNTRAGFIPVSFTTEMLSENFSWNSYFIEHVKKTTVYSDATLSTPTSTVLSDGTEVRIVENANGIAKILYKTENGYEIGYISSSDIKNVPNVAIRNILIVLAVAASVCGTTTYFILRRKDN